MEVRDRIKKAVKWLIGEGYANSQKEVGKLLGYANESAFSQVLNGHVDLPVDFIHRLCALDSRINFLWIQKGEGQMLVESSTAPMVANSDTVSIPREAWEVIRSQAASLERKDRQVDEVLAMLRAEMKKGEDADYPSHVATRAAAD